MKSTGYLTDQCGIGASMKPSVKQLVAEGGIVCVISLS